MRIPLASAVVHPPLIRLNGASVFQPRKAAVSLSPAQIELMNFNDIEVLRECQNIDILAHSKAGGWKKMWKDGEKIIDVVKEFDWS